MDDLIYRNNAIAEENIDPHGRPAKDEFEEFSEEVSEHTDLGLSLIHISEPTRPY